MIDVVRRNPEFRKLWLAQVVSQAGDWLSRVAVLALIGKLSGPAAATGMGALFGVEIAIRFLPTAVFAPFAGPVADRLPRLFLMVTADLLRSAVVLGLLLVREPEHLPLLYGLLLAQMSLAIFFDSARSASLPNTVPKEDLHAAYALSAATWSTMLAFGAFLGGVLVATVGVSGVFIIDALTYVLSALLLIGVRLPELPKHPEAFSVKDVLLMVELRRALNHARERGVAPILFTKTIWGAAGGFLVLLSIVGTARFGEGGDPTAAGLAVGWLFCARGVGTGLGPILARRFIGSSDLLLRRQILFGFALAAFGYACFAVAPTLPLAFLCVTIAHMGGSTIWVGSTTFWQRRIDDAFRGRTFALEFLGMTVAFTTFGVLTGLLYDWTGSIEISVWSGCVAVALAGLAFRVLSRSALLPTAEA